jgi:uncharacterized membrane protein YfhO
VDTDQVLAAMTEPDFDPHRTVILEQQPEPAPEPPAPGHQGSQIWVVDRSTDHLDLELDVEAPALLLMTDSYSNGWRARPLEGSVQSHYEVLPANYVLRAIPLRAGRHHLRVEYSPWAWRAGVVVSSVSLGIFAAAIVYAIWRRSATR